MVYAAVIQAAYDGPDVSYFVILDTTEPWTRWGVFPCHAKKLGLPLAVRASYAAKNFAHFHIRPDLQLPHSYTLASSQEIQATYNRPATYSPRQKELKQKIRESWGVITLSRVGFDLRRQHAVVYAQLTYCGLCGGGDYFYLAKENGRWHVIDRAGTWIS
jgi:hypothetical protein